MPIINVVAVVLQKETAALAKGIAVIIISVV
jgi:hypothetical protein